MESLFAKQGQFDIVYETVDKSDIGKMAKLVKTGGVLLALGAMIIKGAIQGALVARKLKLILVGGVASVNSKDMEFIAEICENGKLKPVIDKTYTLPEMAKAHAYVNAGHKKGNVVIKIV